MQQRKAEFQGWTPDITFLWAWPAWIDAGGSISGESTIEEMREAILDRVIQVASGDVGSKA